MPANYDFFRKREELIGILMKTRGLTYTQALRFLRKKQAFEERQEKKITTSQTQQTTQVTSQTQQTQQATTTEQQKNATQYHFLPFEKTKTSLYPTKEFENRTNEKTTSQTQQATTTEQQKNATQYHFLPFEKTKTSLYPTKEFEEIMREKTTSQTQQATTTEQQKSFTQYIFSQFEKIKTSLHPPKETVKIIDYPAQHLPPITVIDKYRIEEQNGQITIIAEPEYKIGFEFSSAYENKRVFDYNPKEGITSTVVYEPQKEKLIFNPSTSLITAIPIQEKIPKGSYEINEKGEKLFQGKTLEEVYQEKKAQVGEGFLTASALIAPTRKSLTIETLKDIGKTFIGKLTGKKYKDTYSEVLKETQKEGLEYTYTFEGDAPKPLIDYFKGSPFVQTVAITPVVSFGAGATTKTIFSAGKPLIEKAITTYPKITSFAVGSGVSLASSQIPNIAPVVSSKIAGDYLKNRSLEIKQQGGRTEELIADIGMSAANFAVATESFTKGFQATKGFNIIQINQPEFKQTNLVGIKTKATLSKTTGNVLGEYAFIGKQTTGEIPELSSRRYSLIKLKTTELPSGEVAIRGGKVIRYNEIIDLNTMKKTTTKETFKVLSSSPSTSSDFLRIRYKNNFFSLSKTFKIPEDISIKKGFFTLREEGSTTKIYGDYFGESLRIKPTQNIFYFESGTKPLKTESKGFLKIPKKLLDIVPEFKGDSTKIDFFKKTPKEAFFTFTKEKKSIGEIKSSLPIGQLTNQKQIPKQTKIFKSSGSVGSIAGQLAQIKTEPSINQKQTSFFYTGYKINNKTNQVSSLSLRPSQSYSLRSLQSYLSEQKDLMSDITKQNVFFGASDSLKTYSHFFSLYKYKQSSAEEEKQSSALAIKELSSQKYRQISVFTFVPISVQKSGDSNIFKQKTTIKTTQFKKDISTSIDTRPPPPTIIDFPFFPNISGIDILKPLRKIKTGKQKTKYTPSLYSLIYKRRGKKPKLITGIQEKPIIKGFSWFSFSNRR